MGFWEVTKQLADGFGVILIIFGITLLCSLPLGLIITFGSMSKFPPIKWLTKTFVWIIRGTPLMLQIILIFYGPGLIFKMNALPRMTAVLIAFVINYSCYFSEIYRGGIESISKGQYEAGQVLGMTKSQIFFKIVLFQVVKRIVPPMGNEIITLVKDTSLARVIAVAELVKAAENIVSMRSIIWPLFYIGAFYLAFSALLTVLLNFLEKKMNYYSG
ncbi:MAG: amino acid ABC transporter permease [Ruminococcus sp.]|nr:amino acid ABC transporter permease [Ruminococcus sp.]